MPRQLRQYRITYAPVPDGDRAVDPNALGLRSKLGGAPDWEQNDDTPQCPGCGQQMTFVGQIDSMEHWSVDNPHSIDPISGTRDPHFMFGDVGLIYVFFCSECLEPAALFQCG